MKSKLTTSIIFTLSLLFLLAPTSALAATETATVGFSATPRSGSTLYKNAYTPVDWSVQTNITSTRKDIWPMIRADLDFPPASQMTFNPSSATQVCPDSKINASTPAAPVTAMVNLCPKSILGHGDATFALAQSTAPSAIRQGYMVIFNGGLVNGRPKIKITAWSYETNAGVYTEGVLQADGSLLFNIPRLSSDSSVISLNLEVPSKTERAYIENLDTYVTLPGGQDPNYVRMKCSTGSFLFAGDFLLGQRDAGDAILESVNVQAATSAPCTGASGPAKLAVASIKGPGSAKSGKKTTYTVLVQNKGASDARRAVILVKGAGVSAKKSVGDLMPGTVTSVKVPLVFKSKGSIKASFKASAAGVKVVSKSKTVKVK